jgi:hypothetical protein
MGHREIAARRLLLVSLCMYQRLSQCACRHHVVLVLLFSIQVKAVPVYLLEDAFENRHLQDTKRSLSQQQLQSPGSNNSSLPKTADQALAASSVSSSSQREREGDSDSDTGSNGSSSALLDEEEKQQEQLEQRRQQRQQRARHGIEDITFKGVHKMVVVVLADGSAAALRMGSGELHPVAEWSFSHWLCAPDQR